MVALEARLFYRFGEESEFMQTNEYRDMIEKIARSEDSVIGYFDRICRQLGFRDLATEDEDYVLDLYRDSLGAEPGSVQITVLRRLIGTESVSDDSAAIWILTVLGDYDVFETGAYEMLNGILDVAEMSFYSFAQGGEYSYITLKIFDIESLRAQVGFNPIGIINRWGNP